MEFNKYQSSVEELKLKDYPQEIQEQFWDFIYNVPFIQRLVSPNRPYFKDLPKDEKGRAIIDITNPPILTDMDYFRPTAIQFQKTGKFTNLRPNSNPNSDYGKWIREEIRRCFFGYARNSDGAWITGDEYFFLNYWPILQTKYNKGSRKGERIIDFPEVWDGIFLRHHYIEQAINGGVYDSKGGNNGCEISSRGKSKSYVMSAIMGRRFVLGEPKDEKEALKAVKCMATAYQKQYLTQDGILNKFQAGIDFLAQNTQFPSKRLKSSLQDMSWKMGYKDLDTGTDKGTLNEVIGVSAKDDISKVRGKRQNFIVCEEFGCHIKGTKVIMADGSIEYVENIKVGDLLMGDDGTPRKVLHCHNGIDQLYKITLSNGDYQIVNSKHLIYYRRFNWNTHTYKELLQTPEEVMQCRNLDKGNYIIKSNIIRYQHQEVIIDPYWIGLWLGDGDSGGPTIANEDIEVIQWLQEYATSIGITTSKYKLHQAEKCYNVYTKGKSSSGKTFRSILRDLNLINNKHIPNCYKYTDEKSMLKLIAGLIDTDGNYNKRKRYYEITQKYTRKHILDDIKFMCDSLGFKTSFTTRISSKNCKGPNTLHYRLRISGDVEKIPVKIERKKAGKPSGYRNRRNWNEYTFKVEPYGIGEYYGFEIDGNHLFLLEDFTIVHNSFRNVLELYNIMIPSVQEGDISFGTIYLIGTSGEDESDFAGAQEIVYNPKGYRMYGVPNVYDKEGQGRQQITFFFPGYLSRKGCYDENGNSDVTKALLEILSDRYRVKYNSTDVNSITKTIAEIPITPQEAILRTKGNLFPITQLNERITQLDNNPNEYDDVWCGNLTLDKSGQVKFTPSNDVPIRNYPLKDNTAKGCIEIFEMPEKSKEGKVLTDRYIAGFDPYDNDQANSMSLGSILVLDLFTDRIVAEYTGRTTYAEELYETVRLLCLFYNAKCMYESNLKGCYSYFSKMNCVYLLADTPEYLRDKQIIKYTSFGNNSKGIKATAAINNYADNLIKEWLIKPIPTIIREDNEEKEATIPNLYFIRNRALLKELVAYNPFINVDRVRALGQLMLYREEKIIMYQGDMSRTIDEKKYKNAPEYDEFFTENFDKRFA